MRMKKIMRVNLSNETTSIEEVSSNDGLMYLGGRGLGAAMLYRELEPRVDPLGPENKMFFLTGPLTGTTAPGSSRYLVTTKSPLTGCYLMGLSGGYFGPEFKKTGYDGFIIEGKSDSPVYMVISDDDVVFRKADKIWGTNTDIAQERIKEELKSKDVRVTCIGPAGENKGLYSCLMNERRAVGRGGFGAVMGSKNLKAIAVKGSRKVKHAKEDEYREAVKKSYKELKANPATSKGLPFLGTSIWVGDLNERGILPWNNFSKNYNQDVVNITGKFRDYVIGDNPCAPPCPVTCSKQMLSRQGKYAGSFSEGPEYETVFSFGTCLGITDMNAIIYFDSLCDMYGLDTMSCGVSIAFAMECFERGIISEGDTGGIELRFGNAEPIAGLIRDIAFQQGFGKTLALGTKRMAEEFGRDSSDFAMHAKGLELGGYDPRGVKGMSMVYACGSRGGCHHAGGYTIFPEAISGKMDPLNPKGKANIVKTTRDRRTSFCDSSIMCSFVGGGVLDSTLAEMISATTGENYDVESLMLMGERINTLERMFNIREGLEAKDDTLPKRLIKEAFSDGPTKGQIVEIDILKKEFYKECGWDADTGIPLENRLRTLGLQALRLGV